MAGFLAKVSITSPPSSPANLHGSKNMDADNSYAFGLGPLFDLPVLGNEGVDGAEHFTLDRGHTTDLYEEVGRFLEDRDDTVDIELPSPIFGSTHSRLLS